MKKPGIILAITLLFAISVCTDVALAGRHIYRAQHNDITK